jgi:hypothetical protein
MKMFRFALAGVLSVSVLLVANQFSAGATCMPQSSAMQSWFTGDHTANDHIWLRVGMLDYGTFAFAAKLAAPPEFKQLSFEDRVARLPARNRRSLLAPPYLAEGTSRSQAIARRTIRTACATLTMAGDTIPSPTVGQPPAPPSRAMPGRVRRQSGPAAK